MSGVLIVARHQSFEFELATKETQELESKLATKNDAMGVLEQRTGPEPSGVIERNKKKIVADLDDVGKRVEEFERVQSKQNVEAAQKGQTALGALKSRKEDFARLQQTVEASIEFLNAPLENFNDLISAANELIKTLGLKETFPKLSYPDKIKLEAVLTSVKTETRNLVTAIEKEQKELEKLERSVKDHAKLLERKRELEQELKTVEEQIKKLDNDKLKMSETAKERDELFKELLRSVIAQKKAYEAIINTFSANKAEVLSDIDFVADIAFDADGLLSKAEGVLDNRRVEVGEAFGKIIELSQDLARGDDTKVDPIWAEIAKSVADLKSKLKGQPVTVGDLYDLLYRNYMTVRPVVKYKKTVLEKLSLGQKATVLIKIYLAHGDKPIIIDSHDDHLDNEFIMDELVKAIKQAKCYRQVILVSNNGNVVINSDAEQIIVASREGDKITYASGSIENPTIRDQALRILEGGPEAFRKRQQKYRLGS